MNELIKHIQDQIPWCMILANDVVLVDESRTGVNLKLGMRKAGDVEKHVRS